MDNREFDDIKRLNFENLIWIINIGLSVLNIVGDNCDKRYLSIHDINSKRYASKIFKFTVIVSFFIYLYFFLRNYHDYECCSEDERELYLIRLLSSAFFIAGTICLLYFNFNIKSIDETPDDLGYQ